MSAVGRSILTSHGFERVFFDRGSISQPKIGLYLLKDLTSEKIEQIVKAIQEEKKKGRDYGGKLEALEVEIKQKPFLYKEGNLLRLVSKEEVLTIQQTRNPIFQILSKGVKTLTPKEPSTEEIEHYKLAEAYAHTRTFDEKELGLVLTLDFSEEEAKQCSQYVDLVQTTQTDQLMISGIVQLDKEGSPYVAVEFQQAYDHPGVKLWTLVALQALREKKISIAQKILHHLHGLDVESYLETSAEKNIQKVNWENAKHHYHALTLMHPFFGHYYIQHVRALSELNRFQECIQVCRQAQVKIRDPLERKLLRYKIVMSAFLIGKEMTPEEASRSLQLLFEMVEIGVKDQEKDPILLKVPFEFFKKYAEEIGYFDEKSFKTLFGLTQNLLVLTDSFDLTDEEVQKIRRPLAEQLMKLLCNSGIQVDETVKSYILSMAHSFADYPNIIKMFANWCLQNKCPEVVVEFYENPSKPLGPETLACYYLAQALVAVKNQAPPHEVKALLLKSYEAEKATYTAFNLGSFLLPIEPQLANQYFTIVFEMERESPDTNHLLYLWASQVLLGNIQEAETTLTTLQEKCYHVPHIFPILEACRTFLKKQEAFSCKDVLKCAGLIEDTRKEEEASRKAVASFIPQEVEEWIALKKIALCDGYIGIPIIQRNTTRCSNPTIKDYDEELPKKLKDDELLTLPSQPQDCWIGKKGKNNTPRVDIERYESGGNAPNFQRFRFQQGSHNTYGGLWLPINYPLSKKIILEAYNQWKTKDISYLVVFHPEAYSNLGTIYIEIFGMDENNRAHYPKIKSLGLPQKK